MKSMKLSKIAAFAAFLGFSAAVAASGGPSGPAVTYPVQGHIGEVIVNPYNFAPLTAVIRDGGYKLDDVTVKILPKPNGRTIEYKVSKRQLKTHAGVPVFGLYQDYLNTVEVSYTRTFQGKAEKFTDRYQFYAPSIYTRSNGMPNQRRPFTVEVQKVDPEFADRLYLVDAQLNSVAPQGARFTWNNPSGGALEWAYNTNVGIIDTAGEVRWWLFDTLIGDPENPWYSGYFMGFQQTKDGALTWGFGQRYVKYDLMGREIFNRRLPSGYSDFSHSFDNAQNGNSLLRVAAFDYRRADNKRVHTVRDVIVEIDPNGGVVDDWRLAEILDPYRSNVIKALDQGAVCLNIDASKAGQTLSAEDLAKQEQEGVFGDVAGVGPGRNWAHVNSVDYDPTDDSIIISSRHQSAVIKIGRDKKVKWILSSPEGWREGWADKVLTPVDKDGKPIKCEGSKCEGSFDWSWTQHTAWRIDEKSDKDTVYITVFDNGDARGMEQPALAEDKYTRGVIYKIDQKKMTVEQIWEVGKDLGHEYYSPVTGLCGYEADKNSVTVFYSTAGLSFQKKKGTAAAATSPHPYLYEYRWGETQPAVALKFTDVFGYQAFPISVKKAFTDN
ncbi:aryl-sulfate sulfotransferase [Sutterella wadsworthensis]|uniref:aryl-sulfate sulfotransferase n=1 Tax=Sutterella wadsworthensis TaxID=40545 RepID=UPI003F5A0B6C